MAAAAALVEGVLATSVPAAAQGRSPGLEEGGGGDAGNDASGGTTGRDKGGGAAEKTATAAEKVVVEDRHAPPTPRDDRRAADRRAIGGMRSPVRAVAASEPLRAAGRRVVSRGSRTAAWCGATKAATSGTRVVNMTFASE